MVKSILRDAPYHLCAVGLALITYALYGAEYGLLAPLPFAVGWLGICAHSYWRHRA